MTPVQYMVAKGLFTLHAPTSKRRRRYIDDASLEMMTQRVLCECYDWLSCGINTARRGDAVSLTRRVQFECTGKLYTMLYGSYILRLFLDHS